MPDVFTGIKRTVPEFTGGFLDPVLPDTHCDICGRRLVRDLCPYCDPDTA